VLEADVVRDQSRGLDDSEYLLEMARLPRVGDVQDAVRPEVGGAEARGGEVRRRVVEAAVGLLDDEDLVVLVGHDHGALRLDRDASRLEILDDLGEIRIIERLAALLERLGDAEPSVDLVELGSRGGAYVSPQPSRLVVGVRLQRDDALPRASPELIVHVEPRLGGFIKPDQIAEIGRVGSAARTQLLDEHAKLRSPIADVVLPHHLVPARLERVREGVADHRRPEVADVHLFGDVWRRVVYDDALLRARRHRLRLDRHRLDHLRQQLVPQPNVQEPGPRHLDLHPRTLAR